MRQARMLEIRASSSGVTSGSGARPAGNRLMPAANMDKLFRHGNTCRLHEVDCNQPGDVGDREFVASDEFSSGKLVIEQLREFQGLRLVDLAPFGNLRDLPVLHGWMDVTEGGGDRAEQVELDAALPHLDHCFAESSLPEQRRLGLQLLEITA